MYRQQVVTYIDHHHQSIVPTMLGSATRILFLHSDLSLTKSIYRYCTLRHLSLNAHLDVGPNWDPKESGDLFIWLGPTCT